jgi:hypothetical protein
MYSENLKKRRIIMFYVGAYRPDGTEILGSGSGQGFYAYKRLAYVLKILRENHVGKHERFHGVEKVTYRIWNISESEKFRDFESYKKPVAVL